MKERSFKFSRFIAGALAALMVITSLPETALVAQAAPAAPTISYEFYDASGTLLDSESYSWESDTLDVLTEAVPADSLEGYYALEPGEALTTGTYDEEHDENEYWSVNGSGVFTNVTETLSGGDPLTDLYRFPTPTALTSGTYESGTYYAASEDETVFTPAELQAGSAAVYGVTADLEYELPDTPAAAPGYQAAWALASTAPEFASIDTDSETGAQVLTLTKTGLDALTANATIAMEVVETPKPVDVKVTFALNGGAATSFENPKTVTLENATESGKVVDALNYTAIAKEGYYQDGWEVTSNKEAFEIPTSGSDAGKLVTKAILTTDQNVTVSLKWKQQGVTFASPKDTNYAAIEYAEEVAPGTAPVFKAVDLTKESKFTVSGGKDLYVRMTPAKGYGVADESTALTSDVTVTHVVDPDILNRYGTKASDPTDGKTPQVYVIDDGDMLGAAVTLTPVAAIPTTSAITFANKTNGEADDAPGGTNNPFKVVEGTHTDDAAEVYVIDNVNLTYGKTYTVSFKGNDGAEYAVATTKTGEAAVVTVGEFTKEEGAAYTNWFFTLSNVTDDETVTVIETIGSQPQAGVITFTAGANGPELTDIEYSTDGENWTAYKKDGSSPEVKPTVKYGQTLNVRFKGTNGYAYTTTATATGSCVIGGFTDKIELVAGTDDDGKPVYTGSFTVTNIYEDSSIAIAGTAAAGKTVTINAASGDGAAKAIQYYTTGWVDGNTFKAGATSSVRVRFAATANTIYTVTADSDNVLLSAGGTTGSSTVLADVADGYGTFTVSRVAADATVTITPSTEYTVKVVDDADANFATLLEFSIPKDKLSDSYTLEAAIAEQVSQGKTFKPVKEGYFYEKKVWNKETETKKNADATTGKKMSLSASGALTGAETTFVVAYTPIQYDVMYYDWQYTDEDGNAIYPNDEDCAPVDSIEAVEYADTKNTYRAGSGTAATAVEAKEKETGYKFTGNWKAYRVTYLDGGNNPIYDVTPEGVTVAKIKVDEFATIANGEILPNTLSITNGGLVYMVPVYEDVAYTVNFTNGYEIPGTNAPAAIKGSMSSITLKASALATTVLPESGFTAVGYEVYRWQDRDTAPGRNQYGIGGEATYYNVFVNVANGGKFPSSVTLDGVWGETEYTITYHLAGGTVTAPATTFTIRDLPKAVTLPNALAGYDFKGYYFDSEYKKIVSNNVIDVLQNVDVYAKWNAAENEITFKANNGTTDEDVKQTAKTNIPVKLKANTFKNEGFDFAGWSLDGSSDVKYLDGATATFDGATDLYAVWAKDGEKYTATLDYNGGKLAATNETWKDGKAEFTYGDAASYPALPTAAELTKDNYKLSGWQLESGETITSLAGLKGNITAKAVWAGDVYTVTYLSNAATLKNTKVTGSMKPVSVAYGDTWAPLDCGFTAKGYSFVGWSTNAQATISNVDIQPAIWDKTENQTYYAIWQPDYQYLTLYSEYGDIDLSSYKLGSDSVETIGRSFRFTYTYNDTGKSVTLPTAAQMEPDTNGLKFAGFFKSAKDVYGNPTFVPSGKKVKSVKLGDDTVYVAKWTGNYQLTYYYGDNEKVENRKLGAKKALKSFKFAKDLGLFVGWDVDGDGVADFKNKQKISNADLDKVIGTTPDLLAYDVYAVFAPKLSEYELTIKDDTGLILGTETIKYKKGISAKNLKKIGKKYDADFDHFETELHVKVNSIKKKTAGDQTLVLKVKVPVTKTTLVFNNNANIIGVKVKGSVSKKTVSSNAVVVSGVNNYKADGYKLIGYTDGGNFYQLAPNGKMYLNSVAGGVPDGGPHITEANIGGKITLCAIWQSTSEDAGHIYFYDMAAPAVVDAGLDANYPAVAATYPKTIGGSVVYANTWIQDGQAYKLAEPTRAGYIFTGWLEQNAKGQFVKTTTPVTGAFNRYLVATWKPVE